MRSWGWVQAVTAVTMAACTLTNFRQYLKIHFKAMMTNTPHIIITATKLMKLWEAWCLV